MKNHKKLFEFLVALTVLCGCAILPPAARAQFIGYTSPQTVQTTLATNLACTGATQTFVIPNLGQTQHYAYISTSGIQSLFMQILGVDAAGISYLISDTATTSVLSNGVRPVLAATGYFPKTIITILCLPATTGTFTLNYSGTSSTSNLNAGGYQLTQTDKSISSGLPANTSQASDIASPFQSSAGVLTFAFTGTGPAGSTLSIGCGDANGTAPLPVFTFALATTTAVDQTFDVPPIVCPLAIVQYNSGGASTATYTFDYLFTPPGTDTSSLYAHVTSTTATVIKGGAGIVRNVIVGTPATGTISLFDLAPAACTGTPATGIVSVLNETATNPPASLPFGSLFQLGICAKASVAGDYTVVFQ